MSRSLAHCINLQVVSLDSPVEIRQAAAVNFKNFVKFNWVRLIDTQYKSIKEPMHLRSSFSWRINRGQGRMAASSFWLCPKADYFSFMLSQASAYQDPAEDADIGIADGEKVGISVMWACMLRCPLALRLKTWRKLILCL